MSTVRVLSHADAVRGATRHFLHRGTLDMEVLARELAVSRATLYRTVGSRDALLGHVLTGLGRKVVDAVEQAHHPPGAEGVIEVSRRFTRRLEDAQALRWFAQHEPEAAHRVLLTTTCHVHALTVDVQRDLFVRIGGPGIGRVPSPRGPVGDGDPLTDRAFVYVRILESVLYGPMLAGRRPQFGLAEPALRALLT